MRIDMDADTSWLTRANELEKRKAENKEKGSKDDIKVILTQVDEEKQKALITIYENGIFLREMLKGWGEAHKIMETYRRMSFADITLDYYYF